MKQKRKEMGISSSKKGLNLLGIAGLVVILGGILCLAAIGLLNKSAIAADEQDLQKINYDGVDDIDEVVYGLSFIETSDNNPDSSNIYKGETSLYITPKNVVVNVKDGEGIVRRENKVEGNGGENVYGHILGGWLNTLSSDNVTIIAGQQNLVEANNPNATILGGNGNNIFAGDGSRTAILVGGIGNRIQISGTSAGSNTIIGGSDNKLEGNATDATILGGNGNEIKGSDAIVGGSNVKVSDGVKNVFAFSDGSVLDGNTQGGLEISNNTEGSNAFYLEVSQGLGINVEPGGNGVDAGGAVGFGVIDLDENEDVPCDENSYGLQGTRGGCLLGCTIDGWDILDKNSDSCKSYCELHPELDECKCVLNPDSKECICELHPESEGCKCELHPELDECQGKCGEGGFVVKDSEQGGDKKRMKLCPGLDPSKYIGMIFNKVLIDSVDACPSSTVRDFGDNQCVYQCEEDFHIVVNDIDMPEKGLIAGEKGCYQSCKRGLDEVQEIEHGQTGVWYSTNDVNCAYDDEDTHNPKSVYTCGMYKATLICVDGELYTTNKVGDKYLPVSSEDDDPYKYTNCNLHEYVCKSDKYKLSKDEITSEPYRDSLVQPGDRQSYVGNRGIYTLCKSFHGQETSPNKNDTCTPDDGYDLRYNVECKAGVATEVDIGGGKVKCAYMCTKDGQKYKHGQTATAYKSPTVNCEWPIPTPNNKCEAVTVQCVDGQWMELNSNGSVTSTVNTTFHCQTVTSPRCAGFNISSTKYRFIVLSDPDQEKFYESCGLNKKTDDGQSCEGDTKYNFKGCGDDYNTIEKTTGTFCEIKPACSSTAKECAPGSDVVAGSVKEVSTSAGTGYEWKCEGKYHSVVNCGPYTCEGSLPSGYGVILSQAIPTGTGNKWSYSASSSLSACEYTCSSFSHYNGSNGCEVNVCNSSTLPNGASVNTSDNPPEENNKTYICDPTSKNPCTFTCPTGQSCNTSGNGCVGNDLYTITYNKGSCKSVSRSGDVVNCGDTVSLPSVTTSTSKPNFVGWSTSSSATTGFNTFTLTAPCSDKTLYAICTDSEMKDCTGTKPSGNGYKTGSSSYIKGSGHVPTSWTYTGSSNPAACEYTCDTRSGYARDGSGCILGKDCGGTKPSGNYVLTGSLSYTGSSNKSWTYKSGSAQGDLGACEWSCNTGSERDGNGCKAIGYQCTKEPKLAIVVTGTNEGLSDNIESKLVAFNYEVKSSDKCIYKCDRSQSAYYYSGTNSCVQLSDECLSEKFKCNHSWVDVVNTGYNNNKYTWECRADGEKIGKTCSYEPKELECIYGGDGPACEGGEIVNDSLNGDCGYKWQCKGSDGTIKDCSMSYVPSKLNVYVSETKNYLSYISNEYCGKAYNKSISQTYIASVSKKYGSYAQCKEVINETPSVRVANGNGSGSWSMGDLCKNGDSYCGKCFECIGGGDKTYSSSTTAGSCKINGVTYSESDSRCAGLAKACKVDKECSSYKTKNYGKGQCGTYTEEGRLTKEMCVSKMESKPWITSQAYGYIKNGAYVTIKDEGVKCDKYSPYCVPCLQCECETLPSSSYTCGVTIKNSHYGSTAGQINNVLLIMGDGYSYSSSCGVNEGQTSTCTFNVPELPAHAGQRVWVEGHMWGCTDVNNCGYQRDVLLFSEVGTVGSHGECNFSTTL